MWCCPTCHEPALFDNPSRPWPPGWRCPDCGSSFAHRDGIICLAPALADTKEGFDPEFFASLAAIEETNFWFVNRAKLINSLLRRHFQHAGSLLEIGCGTGSVLKAIGRRLPDLALYGSELHPEGLALAARRLPASVMLMQMDARNIPARGKFDVIGAFDVIEHIREDEDVLRQIHLALKPGGGTIIAVPQHPWLWSPLDDAAQHQRRYKRGEMEGKLEKAGFRVVYSTSFNALLLPLLIASRQVMALRQRRSGNADVFAEVSAPAGVGRVLSSILRFERALGEAGIRWPAGGSRFVVAART